MSIMHTSPKSSLVSLFLFALLAIAPAQAAAVSAQGELLKSAEHKKLAKEVAAYWTAKEEVKGINEAFDKFAGKVADSQKRLKKGPDILSAVDDWKRIFWLATAKGLSEKKVKKGRVTRMASEPPFTYVVGKKYSIRKGPFPLLLIIADEGAKPDEHLDAAWADPALREGAILAVVHLEGETENWGAQEGIFSVMRTLSQISRARAFGFDYDRIFLAGTGKGFAAAAGTAAAYPHLFAGLIGRGSVPSDVHVKNLRNIQTLMAGAGEGATALAASITEMGFQAPATTADAAADIWAWMQGVKRDAYPKHVTYSPPATFSSSAYWLSVDGVDIQADPLIEAVVDRSSNTITIDAENIGQVTVFYNDKMLDLDSPVKVIVNGNMNEELVPRNKRTMVDLVFNQGDWGRVFTSSGVFAVPAKASE